MSLLGRQVYLHPKTCSNKILQYLIPKAEVKDLPSLTFETHLPQKIVCILFFCTRTGKSPPQTHCI